MSFSDTNSSSSNGSQVMDMIYFNWCINYRIAPLIWSSFAVTCYLLGFPASVITMHELLRRQRTSSHIFMFNLALIDLAFIVFIPFGLLNYMIWHNLHFELISNFTYSLTLAGRPLFMACMCGDCYIAVIHPIVYMTSKKLFVIKMVLSMTTWFITFIYGSLISSLYQLIDTPYSVIPLLAALPVITFCNISVLQALRKPDPSGNGKIHPQKKRALHTIFTSLIMTFIVYLPPAVILSFGNLIVLIEIERICSVTFYGVCFSMTGCVIMPILYLNSVGKLDIFKKWWKC